MITKTTTSKTHKSNLQFFDDLEKEGLSIEDFLEIMLERKLIELGLMKTKSFDDVVSNLQK